MPPVLILLLFLPALARAQSYAVDLAEIPAKLELRYRIAEAGEIPGGYMLLGDLALVPSFLSGDFGLAETVVEFDDETEAIYTFHVPGHRRFARGEERRGPFFYLTPRDVADPEIAIDLATLESRRRSIERRVRREVWLEEVKYGLTVEREAGPRKGLLNINIPVKLPKQIERIIGRGEETNLNVSGRESITIGGESNWCANCPQTEGRPREQKFPDLDMEQKLSVNLHGNIGEKINVDIDHSSMGGGVQSTNRVRLNYTGFDDDIIKLIEMGDTDLIISGAQLISYSGSAKGLFGVKGMAQVGPLDLTVIASKEEGETATGTFTSSGGQASENAIADYNYIKRQYFYFECPGSDFTAINPTFLFVHPLVGGDRGDQVRLFVKLRTELQEELTYTGAKFNIIAYTDPENNGLADSIATGTQTAARYKELVWGEDFDYIQEYGEAETRYIGIRLAQPLDDLRALVAIYRARNDLTGLEFDVGSYSQSGDPLYAELICPIDNEFTPQSSTWKMMMRNVYSIGSGIDARSLVVRIENKDTRESANKDIDPNFESSYLRVFGLDQWDETRSLRVRGSDDRIDSDPAVLNLDLGYIMFPYYEPFSAPKDSVISYLGYSDPDSIPPEVAASLSAAYALLVKRDTLYNNANETAKRNTHKYNIVIEGASRQRTFQLSAFDIIEGSEVVTVDGTRLSRGADYDIDYSTGTVQLRGETVAELPPDARVQISYQHKPLVGGGKSSLLGVGANLNLSKSSRINGTFLYNSVGASRYNPRLGEEPGKTMAFDVNGSFQFNPRWMTGAANLLPRVDTDAQSSLNVSGEVAVSIPNPNVKGEAFIDDMEGIEDSDMISLLRRSWYEASPPYKFTGDTLQPYEKFEPVDYLEYSWFNPNRTDQAYLATSKRDFNPGLDQRENVSVTSLFLRVNDESGFPEDTKWYGVMAGFPGGIDLTTTQYLEIWVNDFQPDSTLRGGVLHVDFGNIDEDFYKPAENTWDDERDPETYIWNSEYDRGFDDDDRCEYPVSNLVYDAEKGTYTNVNCRARNGYQDSEDINKNGYLETTNAYYTLALDLRDSAIVDVQRDFDKERYSEYWYEGDQRPNLVKAWRMYRLDFSAMHLVNPTGMTPRTDAIQHMRFWIENVDELNGLRKQVLEVAQVKFVGNRWEFDGIRDLENKPIPLPSSDMVVKIGTINNKENPDYRPPYTVQQEEGITNREQSLLFGFENLQGSTSFRSIKRFYGTGQDFRQYRELQFFILPDIDLFGLDESVDTVASFYLQVAFDSFNYYEIETPIRREEMRRWIWATIDMSNLTNMKIYAAGELVSQTIPDAADPDRSYIAKVIGDPTLFQVRYLYAGVRNLSGEAIREGSVYFNDLKLGGVRRDVDHAERLSVSTNFANIIQFSGSWQRTGPEFRSLKQKTGSGVTNSGINLSGKTSINHFVPTGGFDLPVSGKYSSTTALPKYVPQSDVEIADDAVRDSLKTVNENYSYSVSLSRSGSTNFIMKNLFDNLKGGFTYSKRSLKSYNTLDTTWTMSGNANYQINFGRGRQLGLFRGIKWRYWLSNFSYSTNASRKIRRYFTLTGGEFVKRPLNYEAVWDNEISTLYDPFESLKINFSMSEQRNLGVDHDFHGVPIGVRTDYRHSLMLQFQPRGNFFLLSQFNPNFEYRALYREDLKPSIRQEDDPFGTRDVGNNRTISISFDVDVGGYVVDFGEMVNLIEEGDVQRSGRRGGGRSAADREEAFKQMLRDQQQPKKSEKAGKTESIFGPDAPPQTGDESQPSPRAAGEPAAEEAERGEPPTESPAQRIGAARLRPGETIPLQETEPEKKVDEGKEKEAGADSVQGRRYDPLVLPKQLVRLIGKVDPVKTSIRLERTSSYLRLYERASLGYQLGLTDEAGVTGKSGKTENLPERATGSMMIDLSSGVNLTPNVGLDVRANINTSTNEIRGKSSTTDRLSWPNLTVKWSGLEKRRLLERFIKQSDITVKFERKLTKDVRGEETNYQLNPNWNLTWKNALTTNLALTYSQINREESGQEIWQRSWSTALDLKYNFERERGFGLPLPFLSKKRIKFKSTLTTALNITYTRASSDRQPPASTLSISPRASYKFSNRITGSVNMNYTRSAGGIQGYINHKVNMYVTAEFTF